MESKAGHERNEDRTTGDYNSRRSWDRVNESINNNNSINKLWLHFDIASLSETGWMCTVLLKSKDFTVFGLAKGPIKEQSRVINNESIICFLLPTLNPISRVSAWDQHCRCVGQRYHRSRWSFFRALCSTGHKASCSMSLVRKQKCKGKRKE